MYICYILCLPLNYINVIMQLDIFDNVRCFPFLYRKGCDINEKDRKKSLFNNTPFVYNNIYIVIYFII